MCILRWAISSILWGSRGKNTGTQEARRGTQKAQNSRSSCASCVPFPFLFLYVSLQGAGANFGSVNVALAVGGDTFGGTGAGRFFDRIGNEVFDRAVFGAADSNAAFPSVVVSR